MQDRKTQSGAPCDVSRCCVCSCCEEQRHRLVMPAFAREHQGSAAFQLHMMHIAAVRQQQLHHLLRAHASRDQQRRVAVQIGKGLRASRLKQHPGGLEVVSCHCEVQCGGAVCVCHVRELDPSNIEEEKQTLAVRVRCCVVHGSSPRIVLDVNHDAGELQQEGEDVVVSMLCRYMEHSFPLLIPIIDAHSPALLFAPRHDSIQIA
mmetsp:Transcript_3506/g.8190  ORF Transcript_3506/g.8190 Transcript_3506/m.8190 type:complete len:205 (-) Transcript_3506:226-840(-)